MDAVTDATGISSPSGFPDLWTHVPGHMAEPGAPSAELAALSGGMSIEALCQDRKWTCPFTGDEITAAEGLDILALWQRRLATMDKPLVCLGMSTWKRQTIVDFLHLPGTQRPVFATSVPTALAIANKRDARIIVWSTKQKDDVEGKCRRAGVDLWRMEDGFVRSAGLGSNLVPACSHSIDRTGIYYDGRNPSDLETAIATDQHSDRMIERAKRLMALMVEKNVSKYSIGGEFVPHWQMGQGKRVILVPGQVSDDQSILTSAMFHDNLDFLKAVREAEPEAILVYKPHPDVEAGNRQGRIAPDVAAEFADHVITDAPIGAVLSHVDEVQTQTSLVGFEALLRGLPVTSWGMPFYAGWGLTRDKQAIVRRTRHIEIEHLVASALICYPYYRDPVTGLPCPVEIVIRRLEEGVAEPHGDKVMRRLRLAGLNLLRRVMIKG
ncbi:MAG: hypothetical protein Alpg2KO_30740 [Alphaproteobacteria bacterium]